MTKEVNAAVKAEMKPPEAFAARRAVMGKIEKESLDKTGLRSDVVTLYNGGLYHLYRYKKYTDVRLVFAPEQADRQLRRRRRQLRVPADEPRRGVLPRRTRTTQPAKTPHFFKWSETGPAGGDLVFVTGHPGTTNRLETLAKLKHRRDLTLPYTLARLRTLEAALIQYSEQSGEKRRQAATDLHRVANARKAFGGQYQGLLDPAVMAQKKTSERQLLESAAAYKQRASMIPGPVDPKWLSAFDDTVNALEAIEATQVKLRGFEKAYGLTRDGPRLLLAAVRHRPALRPDGRRAAEEVGRPAPRVPRLQPGIAQVPALQPGPAVPGAGAGQAHRVAHVPGGEPRRRTPAGEARARRQEPGHTRGRADRRHEALRPGGAQASR